ncbi:hypothetical protein GCM10022243_09080 [Saccharothrix violaceirubra]|uniref:PPM-type phosphatase domain-containing protein n=1 Tax=Saccharothrix violaceirubra TaxID=413306 RepID=A0A7W7T6T1_9PSEU|nr:GAF domain-containing SpoIIE family protein phosphatase [Saccharothrix violaceirubra]MBB4966255.1 hypothetical protein [Saccharothrix violaceirubra]
MDPWSTRLHELWRVACQAGSTNGFTDELYHGLLSLPGVSCLVGARLTADDRVMLARWADADGIRTSPPGLAEELRAWLATGGPPHRLGVADLPPSAFGRMAGARRFVVALIELADGQRGLLGAGTDADDPAGLHTALRQVSEIVTLADVRISEQRALDDQQARDAILAEASLRMDASLDIADTLRAVVRMAVPALADGAVVHIRRGDRLDQVGVAHVDARRERLLTEHLDRGRWAVDEPGPHDEPRPSGLPADVGLTTMSTTVLRARGREVGLLTFFHRATPPRRTSVAFLRDLAGRAALAIDNATLYEQRRDDVLSLQQHLLPTRLPTVPGLELAAAYNVADHALEVGGDFYGMVTHGDTTTALIGDVCGRGAPAAALTGLARHTLETVLGEGRPAAHAVEILNAKMLDNGISRFLTLATATFTPAGRDLRVETHSAGHPPPLLLRRDGTVTEAACTGRLVGVVPDLNLRPVTDLVEPGDCVVLLTDGLLESRDDQGRFFGDTELLPMLSGLRGLPLPTLVSRLLAGTERYRVVDDAAVLAIRHVGPTLLDTTLPPSEVPAAVLDLVGHHLPEDMALFLDLVDDPVHVTVHGDADWARLELTHHDRTSWAELTR